MSTTNRIRNAALPVSGYTPYGVYLPDGYGKPSAARTSPAPAKLTTAPGTLRASKSGMTVYGFAAPFNSLSVNLGGFRERLMPGCFARTLLQTAKREYDILCLSEHDSRALLGRTGANVILREESGGLRFEVELPETSLGRDVAELVRRGILKGASISFSNPNYTWSTVGTDRVRDVHELRLHEFSFVGSPAYPATTASLLRSAPNETTWKAARLRQAAAVTRVASTPLHKLVLPGNAQRSFVVDGLERR